MHAKSIRLNHANLLVLALFVSVLLAGLFLNIGTSHDRLTAEVMNLAHIPLFFLLTIFLLRVLPGNVRLLSANIIVLVMVVIFALLSEWLQGKVGRSSSLYDAIYDVVGAVWAIIVVTLLRVKTRGKSVAWLVIFVLVVSVALLRPSFQALVDEYQMRKAFPVLADFSGYFEATRWDAVRAKTSIVKNENKKLLQVEFGEKHYSTVSLQHLVSDWRGYNKLNVVILNQEAYQFPVTLRIHDRLHRRNGYHFADRFSKKLALLPGKNHISLLLSDIQNLPDKRQMNLAEVVDLSIFTYNGGKQSKILIHAVYLD